MKDRIVNTAHQNYYFNPEYMRNNIGFGTYSRNEKGQAFIDTTKNPNQLCINAWLYHLPSKFLERAKRQADYCLTRIDWKAPKPKIVDQFITEFLKRWSAEG